MTEYGIIPPSGEYGTEWPAHHVITQGKGGSLSYAGWTEGNEGFIQQTFLGASISNFNVIAGFGDSSSSLSVSVVVDELNKSDELPFGQGDDAYHNGKQDFFKPPVVGTPVFFKFGKNFATVEQAYRKTIDDLTGYHTMPASLDFDEVEIVGPLTDIPDHHYLRSEETNSAGVTTYTFVDKSPLYDPSYGYRGKDHFAFGGILQGWSQSKGNDGQKYDIRVVDPREILSNTTVLLNNYQGTTFNNKNLINVYGYLEYEISYELKEELEGTDELPNFDLLDKSILTKHVNISGVVSYVGDDMYRFNTSEFTLSALPEYLPITGKGMSRRGNQGIPWYRVRQSLSALFNYYGNLPTEYQDAGFGGAIDFRGFKYVVDFSGLPLDLIPKMYFIDFDQMTLIDLAQELCDIISHDMLVTLLPVIDHPSNQWLWNYNQAQIQAGNYVDIITGIIRIDAIDRSRQPEYGAIKTYLQKLEDAGVEITNEDLGYELSNITTDKFVVGAQQVNMYYFNNCKDRSNLQLRKRQGGFDNHYELIEESQWSLETALKQQILPFYGFLGENAVTIPRGFGAFQQIMLDSSTLDAAGVGYYYITTEMELRHVLSGFKSWANFLAYYNNTYVENTDDFGNGMYKELDQAEVIWGDIDDFGGTIGANGEIVRVKSGSYGVCVPRCVFNSDREYMGSDGYPASPCSPPYGYPLYYKRADKIGLPYGSIAGWIENYYQVSTDIAKLKQRLLNKLDNDGVKLDGTTALEASKEIVANINKYETALANGQNPVVSNFSIPKKIIDENQDGKLKDIAEQYDAINQNLLTFKKITGENPGYMVNKVKDIGLDGEKNAKKVFEFLQEVANKHFGKTFLVKIPKQCNLNYSKYITVNDANEILNGPYGFKPQPIKSEVDYYKSTPFQIELNTLNNMNTGYDVFTDYLDNEIPGKYTVGALNNNFNPISEKWEFNYEPSQDGGFFDFEVYDRSVNVNSGIELDDSRLPPATKQMLAPRDLTNLLNDNSRIKCYVRYDHSQYMDFSDIGKDEFSQQIITTNGFVPDALEALDNTGDQELSMDRLARLFEQGPDTLPESCAYIACQLDTTMYMTPKVIKRPTEVYGREVQQIAVFPELNVYKKTVNDTVQDVPILRLAPVFGPGSGNSGGTDGEFVNNGDFERVYNEQLDANLIDTRIDHLDPDYVYVVLTVPGIIKPTVDHRFMDAFMYAKNATYIKHALSQDVVRGAPGFEKPAPLVYKDSPGTIETECGTVVKLFNFLDGARRAQQEAAHGVNRNGSFNRNDFMTTYSHPSPVYPDMVAMPLTSKERCYGPWLSSSTLSTDSPVRYSNIGGRVEFVKDENLAPWNFAGYQLMNEAGKLRAQFSNSLLLFSERGSFTIPEAPTGLAIGTALNNVGPLVTSVDVKVGIDGYRTTVKMDLYTSRFGKLQKQKEQAIAQISRERQKIIDQNNAMTRKGFGKGASKADFLAPLRPGAAAVKTLKTEVKQRLEETIMFEENQEVVRGADVDDGSAQTKKIKTKVATKRPSEEFEVPSGPDSAEERVKKATAVDLSDIISVHTPTVQWGFLPSNEQNMNEALGQYTDEDVNDRGQ